MEGKLLRDPELPDETMIQQRSLKPSGVPAYTGKVLGSVNTLKYLPFERGERWKMIMSALAVLIIVFAIYTQSYIMAVAFGVFIWVYVTTHKESDDIHAPLIFTTVGIYYLDSFYPYVDLKSFYFILASDMTSVNFQQMKVGRSNILIYLEHGQEMEHIRGYLKGYLEEETGMEDTFAHKIIRLLKL